MEMAVEASTVTVDVWNDFGEALGSLGPGGLTLRQEWEALLPSAVSNVIFLTHQWQHTWWRHFGAQNGLELHLLAIRGADADLLGIAPLYIDVAPMAPAREYTPGQDRPEGQGEAQRLVRLVGGVEVADYLDCISPAERLPEVWSAVLDYLAGQRERWDAIDLHSLPQWSPTREILPELAEHKGWSSQVFPEDACPVLALPGDFDTYLMSLRKKDRHELRRKVRKLEGREDSRWRLVPPTDRDAMHEGLRIFLDLHRKSGADKASFMDEQMAAFFSGTIESLLPTGWLDLAILELDGHHAAAYFSFNYDGRIYLYNSGYDPRFASYSAGIALLAYRIHKAINQGLRYFDFLRGDEDYKYDFGGKNTFVYRAILK
jgi:CelD/BcsL family acetyltransferase involved in cellulose biosynthesis